MLLKPLTIAAAGLSAATAFLVPPEITQADVDVNSVPFEISQFAESQRLDLDCPDCPLQVRGQQINVQGIPSHLEMTFTIEHLPTHDRLLLNGFELYPHSDPLRSTLSAPQIPDFKEETRGQRVPKAPKFLDVTAPELGFGLQWQPVAEEAETGMRLISLDLQIIEVANTFVNGIPNIRVRLLKSVEGALMIAKIETTESQTVVPKISPGLEQCDTILCKWRAMVAAQFQRMRGHKCGKMGHRMGKEHHHDHHHGHHHHEHGRPGRPQFHEHSWKQLFKYLGSHILFPVLIGIAAGVSVSILGMVLGTVMVGLWRVVVRGQPFFHRRRHHAGRHHKAAQREAVVAEEKAGLMADQE